MGVFETQRALRFLFSRCLDSSGKKGAAWADTQGARHRVSRLVGLPLMFLQAMRKSERGNEWKRRAYTLYRAQQNSRKRTQKKMKRPYVHLYVCTQQYTSTESTRVLGPLKLRISPPHQRPHRRPLTLDLDHYSTWRDNLFPVSRDFIPKENASDCLRFSVWTSHK